MFIDFGSNASPLCLQLLFQWLETWLPLSLMHLLDQFLCARVLSDFSHVRLSAAPWTVARQAPPSMEFSRQEYWSGLPLPSPAETLRP